MRNALARNRIAERTRHHILPDDIVEALRAVFAREDLIGHGEETWVRLTATRCTCGTLQGLLSATAFRP